MSSRKDQKEALRREREERERQARDAERRRRLIGYAAGGALVAAVLVVLAVLLVAGGSDDEKDPGDLLPGGGSVPELKVTNLGQAAKAAGCELESHRVKIGDTVQERHTSDPNEIIPYQSKPPAGGKHFDIPAEDGAYGEAPKESALVHSLEHGRIVIWFKRSLPKDARADLKALFDQEPFHMILTPDPSGMSYQVAATAWNADPEPVGTGRLLGCPRMSDKVFDALRNFYDEHLDAGPEQIP